MSNSSTRCRPRGQRDTEPEGQTCDDGYSVLEVAITLPIVLMMILLGLQAAVVWFARGVAQDTARQGLRAATAYNASGGAGHDRAVAYLQQVAPHAMTNPKVTVVRTGGTVSVTVSSPVPDLLPFGSFTVHATATGPIEAYRSAP